MYDCIYIYLIKRVFKKTVLIEGLHLVLVFINKSRTHLFEEINISGESSVLKGISLIYLESTAWISVQSFSLRKDYICYAF